MTRDENEEKLAMITSTIEFLELIVLTHGTRSSFVKYDVNGDQIIDKAEASAKGFGALMDKYESNGEEGWDINEYYDFVLDHEEAAQDEFNAVVDSSGWDMYQAGSISD